ncbi:MAG: tRNA (adenosine(37)-N6)-dimethylallyltransferase MiaA [Deltaproteobacteria bacterium GWA2_45_12]|nr:MAG: tRNA (adenosine(37)-N6)-dimethylallyltransferase MiaA [Deltaproteobacteria bacterium GWA2_45_12]
MPNSLPNKKIIVLVGPTGVGKSEVALHLAQKFNGEIVNADSRQLYKEINIGTAKPSETALLEVPHHLYGFLGPHSSWDAAKFVEEADKVIASVHGRNRLPIIVGGTGLYVRALLYGLLSGPKANAEIRKRLKDVIKNEGLLALYKELEKVDPVSAATIHPHDPVRIIRALEVYELTGKPQSQIQEEHGFQKSRYDFLMLGFLCEREKLVRHLNKRVNAMIEAGLEAEVRNLVSHYGWCDLLKTTIGYQEWEPYFEGKISLNQTVEQIKINTRQYAKRQMTWFRKEKKVKWMEAGKLREMEEMMKGFLNL